MLDSYQCRRKVIILACVLYWYMSACPYLTGHWWHSAGTVEDGCAQSGEDRRSTSTYRPASCQFAFLYFYCLQTLNAFACICDRVGHTLIVSVDATTRDEISFPLTFLFPVSDVLSLGPRHHHLPISPLPRMGSVGLAAWPIRASLVVPAWRW